MESIVWIAAGGLLLLALLHTALGELEVLRPLFRQTGWRLPGVGPRQARALLRFAWHLTSLAWLGLVAALLGVPSPLAFGITLLVSGVVVFFSLREHLAWPVFLLAGLAALDHGRFLPPLVPVALRALAVSIAVAAAMVHLYWAAGGRRWADVAVPANPDGSPLFSPGPVACLLVALALCAFAALLVGAPNWPQTWVRYALGTAATILTVRMIGDGKFVGFLKRHHNTAFGRADGRLYTPLVVGLWLGALAGLAAAT
ncbi:MAG: DUF3995 domain-containing protein [Myxococcales bacterium]|nr:DUF3995 domain-containing protein [Myxococcales bacterium]